VFSIVVDELLVDVVRQDVDVDVLFGREIEIACNFLQEYQTAGGELPGAIPDQHFVRGVIECLKVFAPHFPGVAARWSHDHGRRPNNLTIRITTQYGEGMTTSSPGWHVGGSVYCIARVFAPYSR